jgi:hypothetical protein
VDEQDYALRNVAMSNSLPGGGQPAAGAVIGSEGRLRMEPRTPDEEVDDTDMTTAAGDNEASDDTDDTEDTEDTA